MASERIGCDDRCVFATSCVGRPARDCLAVVWWGHGSMYRSLRALAAVVVTALMLLGASFRESWASAEWSCTPAITTSTEAIRRSDGAIVGLDVSTQASASHPDGDRLVSVT